MLKIIRKVFFGHPMKCVNGMNKIYSFFSFRVEGGGQRVNLNPPQCVPL
jgi:hypothetical protein